MKPFLRLFRPGLRFQIVLLFLSSLLILISAQAADITWTNVNGGNWNVAANWNPRQVPGAADHAFITADGTYTVTLNAAATIAGLTLGGASGTQTFTNSAAGALTLTGAGTVLANGVFSRASAGFTCTGALTVHGRAFWTGGSWLGAGSTTFTPGAVLTIGASSVSKQMDAGHVWINSGKIIWLGGAGVSATFQSRGSAVITNLVDGVIELAGDGEFMRDAFGGLGIVNLGSLRKTGGTGQTLVGRTVNQGTIEPLLGTLRLGGNTTNTGTYLIPAGATLSFDDTPVLAVGSRVSGEGNFTKINTGIRIEGAFDLGGTNTLNGADLTFTSGSDVLRPGRIVLTSTESTLTANSGKTLRLESLTLVNGAIAGSDPMVVDGPMTWTDGNIGGTGTLTVNGNFTLNGTSILDLGGRVLRIGGHAIWTSGVIRQGTGSHIENLAGGTFEIATDEDVSIALGGSGVRNFGTLRKTAGTGSTSTGPLVNEGVIEILSGSLTCPNQFVQSASGKLTVRIAGTTPGTQLSQLVITGSSGQPKLDGCLGALLAGGFVPHIGEVFPVVTFPRRDGSFVCFDNMTVPGVGRRFQPRPGTTTFDLTVVDAPANDPLIYSSLQRDQFRVCWGVEFTGYRLQATLDPAQPWQDTVPPVAEARNAVFTAGPGAPVRLFRLIKP